LRDQDERSLFDPFSQRDDERNAAERKAEAVQSARSAEKKPCIFKL
jgi:hypothetical protein